MNRRFDLAFKLIERRAKINIIMYTCELSQAQARGLWAEMSAHPPKGGEVRILPRIARSRERLLEVSIFIQIYRQLASSNYQENIDHDAWVKAYDLYLDLRNDAGLKPDIELDINDCWQIVVGLRRGHDLRLTTCNNCGVTYPKFGIRPKRGGCPCCDNSSWRTRRPQTVPDGILAAPAEILALPIPGLTSLNEHAAHLDYSPVGGSNVADFTAQGGRQRLLVEVKQGLAQGRGGEGTPLFGDALLDVQSP
jgi:hypothetical protein